MWASFACSRQITDFGMSTVMGYPELHVPLPRRPSVPVSPAAATDATTTGNLSMSTLSALTASLASATDGTDAATSTPKRGSADSPSAGVGAQVGGTARSPAGAPSPPAANATRRLTACGTPAWTAPEVFLDVGDYDSKVDVVRQRSTSVDAA